MPKYLVKFTPKEFLPDFLDPSKVSLKIGTFHHYRNIENNILSDPTEGQQGLTLTVKRPCEKLEELKAQKGSYLFYDESDLNEDGDFKAKLNLQIHDHLKEFNAWLFCCSHIKDLNHIKELQSHFDCDSYFFITDVDKYVNSIQRSLAEDLKENPLNDLGEKRVIYQDGKVFIDGFKNGVTYSKKSKWLRRECNTLSEFISAKGSREVDQNLWFQKPDRFSVEQEVRFIYFPTTGREERKRYSTRDDFRILDVDLTDCISEQPVPYF